MISIFKIRTREPRPVPGNLDLIRTLIGDTSLGAWTCTRLCTQIGFFVSSTWKSEYINEYGLRSWPNIGDSYSILYVPWILGQLFDLICLAKINLFEPRLESYNTYDMASTYLLLPLGKRGSKWGVFNHEKGAI